MIRRVLHWTKRGLQVLIIVLLRLAIAGTIYQLVATQIDQRQLGSAPGEMVSVDNHQLHINCMGEGSPTVITESGATGTSIEWSAWIQPEVAKVTRVCAYERAGLGWSEAGPGPRDARQIASELHTLLEGADIPGPYVLVGHSVGGHLNRVYADRYPEEVAGIVLVDSSHPQQFERLPGNTDQFDVQGGSPPGGDGCCTPVRHISTPPDLPPLQNQRAENLIYQTPHLMAAFKEFGALPETMEQAHNPQGLGEKPLAVVSASEHEGEAMVDSEAEARRSGRGRYCKKSWPTSHLTAPIVSSRDRITSRWSPTGVTPNKPARRSSRWWRTCGAASHWNSRALRRLQRVHKNDRSVDILALLLALIHPDTWK